MTHPDVERIKEEILEAERVGYTDGDVNHYTQPVIGILRLAHANGHDLHPEDMEWMIDALYRACQAETAFLAEKNPEKYGSKAWSDE